MSGARSRAVLAVFAGFSLVGCGADTFEPVTLSFVGDILLDSAPGNTIAYGEDPFAPTAALLKAADFSIGNLECPVATSGVRLDKVFTFRAAPSTWRVLRKHFEGVSVANTPPGDSGPAAFREPLERLAPPRFPSLGGGHALPQAHEPLLLEKR